MCVVFLGIIEHQADCKIQCLLPKLTGMIMQLCKELNLLPLMPIPSYCHCMQELENMTLAQKHMAAMIMENTVNNVEAHRARQAATEAEASAAVGGAGTRGEDAEMEQSNDEEDVAARRPKVEEDRQRAIAQAMQASTFNPSGPITIRTDYVPKCVLLSLIFYLTPCF